MTHNQPVSDIQVHKFGGSSLADAFCFRRVARIVTEYAGASDAVVVSAAGDTTNRLLAVYHQQQAGHTAQANRQLTELSAFQQGLVQELLPESARAVVSEALATDLTQLAHWLSQPETLTEAAICAYGEVWSSRLLAALLNHQGQRTVALDSREFLTAAAAAEPVIELAESQQRLHLQMQPYPGHRFIITGFICAEAGTGDTLLLGRNGSDYSATLIGQLLDSRQVTIWKDVAGVYSADPRLVSKVTSLPALDWAEATELARLGSPVLHPRTFQPVDRAETVISVRSSLKPGHQQTRIGQYPETVGRAKVLTTSSDIRLFQLAAEAHQLHEQLLGEGPSPLVHWLQEDGSTLLAYHPNHLEHVRQQVARHDAELVELGDHSLLALVGARVHESQQYLQFRRTLQGEPLLHLSVSPGKCSAVAILQGSVDEHFFNRLHSQLFNDRRRIGLVLLGPGNIGQAWLDLFQHQQNRLNEHAEVRLLGIANSTRLWYDPAGLDLLHWPSDFAREAREYRLSQLLQELPRAPWDDIAILDLTASETLAGQYPSLLANGCHLISANKFGNAASEALYQEIRTIQHEYNRQWLYNTTVGAGMPLNYAIQDLLRSGDRIQSVSGIFSGTLSWLFEQYAGDQVPFSQLVNEALEAGYTEPDPREDLGCQDLARKLLILSRELGVELKPEHLKVTSLVPETLRDISRQEFIQRLAELDQPLLELWQQARQRGELPRVIARLDAPRDQPATASVQLEFVPEHSMLGNLIPGENIFVITSDWYQQMPLVISGPAAGREVIAGGVQSDVHELLRTLA